jgi:hypothetical protein
MKKYLLVIMLTICLAGLVGCESFERGVKDIGSSIGGLNRTLTVYDQNGNVLKTYEGKFDIKQNDYGNQVKFDVSGKRVIIYNAIVITEEE